MQTASLQAMEDDRRYNTPIALLLIHNARDIDDRASRN
jgi:hypothetical protein